MLSQAAFTPPVSQWAARATTNLDEAGVELWLMCVGDVEPDALQAGGLDGEEQRRAAVLRDEDRGSFVAGRLLLRERLSARLGCLPEEVAYARAACPVCGEATGRPILARGDQSLHFSLARSQGLVVVGLADRPVGVDAQAVPRPPVGDEVAGLLHPDERQEIAAAPADMRAHTFARVWTRKEAYLKAYGTGIAHGVDADYVGCEPEPASPSGWWIVDVPAPPGYTVAAALTRSG